MGDGSSDGGGSATPAGLWILMLAVIAAAFAFGDEKREVPRVTAAATPPARKPVEPPLGPGSDVVIVDGSRAATDALAFSSYREALLANDPYGVTRLERDGRLVTVTGSPWARILDRVGFIDTVGFKARIYSGPRTTEVVYVLPGDVRRKETKQ